MVAHVHVLFILIHWSSQVISPFWSPDPEVNPSSTSGHLTQEAHKLLVPGTSKQSVSILWPPGSRGTQTSGHLTQKIISHIILWSPDSRGTHTHSYWSPDPEAHLLSSLILWSPDSRGTHKFWSPDPENSQSFLSSHDCRG